MRQETSWTTIEHIFIGDESHVTLEYRWLLDESGKPLWTEYRLSSNIQGETMNKTFETPDDANQQNKLEAYRAFRDLEEKIFAG